MAEWTESIRSKYATVKSRIQQKSHSLIPQVFIKQVLYAKHWGLSGQEDSKSGPIKAYNLVWCLQSYIIKTWR